MKRTGMFLVFAVVAWAGQALAADARIAVVPVQVGTGVPLPRSEANREVQLGIEEAGHATAAVAEGDPRARGAGEGPWCRTASCWIKLAATAQAAHLVTGSVAHRGPVFRVELRLIDAATGERVASEENQCNAKECILGELVRLSARELVRRTLGRKRVAKVEAAPPTPALTPPAPVERLEQVVTAPGPAVRRAPTWTLLAMGVGVASMASGVALVALDGREATADHLWNHKTLVPGVIALAAGVAVTAVGVRFNLTQRGAVISGRF